MFCSRNTSSQGHYATLKNKSEWQHLWDGKTWIVHTSENISLADHKQTIIQNFMNTTNSLYPGESSLMMNLSSSLNQSLKTEKFNSQMHMIQFPAQENLLPVFQSFQNFSQKDLLSLQYNALQNTPTVQHIEPNLYSPLYSRVPGPGLTSAIQMEDIIKSIGFDRALSSALASGVEFKPIYVAVVDTGVDSDHPYLKNSMYQSPEPLKPYYDLHGFDAAQTQEVGSSDLGGPGKACPLAPPTDPYSDYCGHGTHVAGIIAAKLYDTPGEGPQELGLCPSCQIVSVRVVEKIDRPPTPDFIDGYEVDGMIPDSAQIKAYQYLLNTPRPGEINKPLPHIINMSFGKSFRSLALERLIQSLQDKGVIIVAAAGNENSQAPSYPAAFPNVISVCATTEPNPSQPNQYQKTYFSNYGYWVSLCAPGEGIESLSPGERMRVHQGTSQAAPFISGTIGFLQSINPDKSPKEIVGMLLRGSNSKVLYDSTPAYGRTYQGGAQYALLGTGYLDVFASMSDNDQSEFAGTAYTEKSSSMVTSGGCISSVTQNTWGGFFSSMPLMLIMAYLILRSHSCWKFIKRNQS